jgi:hypothetical protein
MLAEANGVLSAKEASRVLNKVFLRHTYSKPFVILSVLSQKNETQIYETRRLDVLSLFFIKELRRSLLRFA